MTNANSNQRPIARSRRHRRGAALMMVLSVVATGSILSWAMLSASSVRAQVEVNASDSIDAGYLAESGVSYALYYLRYPAKSPVALTTGAYNTYYAGQSGVRLWSDARSLVDITVTNTASYCYTIRATTTVNGTKRTVEADAKQSTVGYQITSAAGFNGAFTFPTNMSINGPVIATSPLTGASGHISNSPTITPTGSNVVPALSDVLIYSETANAYSGGLSTDRQYTFNGKTYAAEKIPTTTVLLPLQTLRSSLNPQNVWWTDVDTTFSGVTMSGTVVVRNAALLMTGTNAISAYAGMPALVATNQLNLKQSAILAGKLTVNGAFWLGDKVISSGPSRNDGTLTVNGSLLMGGASPSISLSGSSATTVTYTPANVSAVDNLSKTRTVNGVTVLGWRSVD